MQLRTGGDGAIAWISSRRYREFRGDEWLRIRRRQAYKAVPIVDAAPRVLWAYRDGFYWDSDGLPRQDVEALVDDRLRRQEEKLQRLRPDRTRTGSPLGVALRSGVPADFIGELAILRSHLELIADRRDPSEDPISGSQLFASLVLMGAVVVVGVVALCAAIALVGAVASLLLVPVSADTSRDLLDLSLRPIEALARLGWAAVQLVAVLFFLIVIVPIIWEVARGFASGGPTR